MKIGRLGSVSKDGYTVIYASDSESIVSAQIPILPIDTEIECDSDGTYHVVYNNYEPEKENRIRQSENFYNATKSFMDYEDYAYIVKLYPTNCYTLYKKNPFFLCDVNKKDTDDALVDISVIDKNNVVPTFEARLNEMRYIFRKVLLNNENQGHTWMALHDFLETVNKTLRANGHPLLKGTVESYLSYYNDEEFFCENGRVGLKATYIREKIIYRAIKRAHSLSGKYCAFNPAFVNTLSDEQNNAVKDIVSKGGNVSILSGGPGTGKTTTLKRVVTALTEEYMDIKIYLLSPTGRASRRIQEVFGDVDVNVSTVHKFVGYGHFLSKAERKRILEADVIIIDESSMLDLEILGRLLDLVNMESTKIIFVGDIDQLPSVGAGNVLKDLIALGVYTVYLTANYRSDGVIINNSRLINKGCFNLTYDDTFQLIDTSSSLVEYLSGVSDGDIIITPYRVETSKNSKRLYGSTQKTNKYAQKKRFGRYMSNKFNIGDSIIMVKTNYAIGYFNGESGKIIGLNVDGSLVVEFDDRTLTIKNLKHCELGYAITVHKSQGSEYSYCDIIIPKYSDFITRKMLYTAITRAKSKVRLWTNKEILRKVILNNKEEKRNTYLSLFPKF